MKFNSDIDNFLPLIRFNYYSRMKRFFIVVLIALSACGIQSQLNRTFTGKDLAFIEEQLRMKVSHISQIENGLSKAVFVKTESLRSTTINQGQGTLDPIRSPSVDKTEYFIFILDENGQVIKSEYNKEYERR